MSEYVSIKEEVLQKLETNMPEIRERFGIEVLAVFGSVSRGEDTSDSDVDILYKFSTQTIRLSQFMGLKEYLTALLNREVDLVGMNWIEPMIEPGVRKDMILIPSPSEVAA